MANISGTNLTKKEIKIWIAIPNYKDKQGKKLSELLKIVNEKQSDYRFDAPEFKMILDSLCRKNCAKRTKNELGELFYKKI